MEAYRVRIRAGADAEEAQSEWIVVRQRALNYLGCGRTFCDIAGPPVASKDDKHPRSGTRRPRQLLPNR